MQPLGGTSGKRTGRKKRQRGGIASDAAAGGRSALGILLATSGSWRGGSQRFGSRRQDVLGSIPRLRGRWRTAAGLFLAATALYGVVAGGYIARTADYLARKTTRVIIRAGFAIEQLTIEGQNRTSDKELVKALALGPAQSALTYDSAAAQARLERLPWVRRAQVMRLLPSRLHIILEERVSFAVWQRNGKTHLIDRDGVVIAPARASDHPDLAFVVGAGAAREAAALFDLLSVRPALKARVRAAVRVAERRWNLKLDNDVEIQLPEENLAHAIARIEQLDKQHGILAGEVTLVDLRLPGRVTIRLTKEAAARRDAALTRSGRRDKPIGRDT